MNYKFLAIFVSVLFVLSCLGMAFAHPGHGSEYVEEVSSSSDISHSSSVAQSSNSGSGSSSSSAGSSGGSSSSSAGSSGGSSSSSASNDKSVNPGNDVKNTNESLNNTTSNVNSSINETNDGNELFSLNNIIILIFVFIIGFLATVLIFKLFK